MAIDAIVRALWRTAVEPAPPARVDDGRGGAGVGDDRPARPCVRKHWGVVLAAVGAAGLALMAAGTPYPAARHAALRRLGAVAAVDLVGQPAAAAAPRRRARRATTAPTSTTSRATPGACSSAASAPRTTTCRPTTCRSRRSDMVAHRTSPTNIGLYLLATAVRARLRLDRHARDRSTGSRRRSRHAGDAAAPPRPLPQLVRHRARRRRCCRSTSPPSTAATSARTCSRWPRPASSSSRERRRRFGAAPRAGRARRRGIAALARRGRASRSPAGALAALLGGARSARRLDADPARLPARSTARRRARAGAARRRRAAMPTPAHRLAWAIEDRLSTLRSALRDLERPSTHAQGPPARRRRDLPARSPREADFTFLFNRKRRLFHIGFRVAEHQLDAGFYDLLASEARAPACGRSPRATCPPPTGPRSAGRSSPSASSPACARGRARCSST